MEDLLKKIDAFIPVDNDFYELEVLLEELENSETPESGMISLFKVLERFPEESKPKVFWNIMYFLEEMEGHQYELVNSLKRRESDITMMFLNQLFFANTTHVGNEKMEDLLSFIKNNPNTRKSTIVYINEDFV